MRNRQAARLVVLVVMNAISRQQATDDAHAKIKAAYEAGKMSVANRKTSYRCCPCRWVILCLSYLPSRFSKEMGQNTAPRPAPLPGTIYGAIHSNPKPNPNLSPDNMYTFPSAHGLMLGKAVIPAVALYRITKPHTVWYVAFTVHLQPLVAWTSQWRSTQLASFQRRTWTGH